MLPLFEQLPATFNVLSPKERCVRTHTHTHMHVCYSFLSPFGALLIPFPTNGRSVRFTYTDVPMLACISNTHVPSHLSIYLVCMYTKATTPTPLPNLPSTFTAYVCFINSSTWLDGLATLHWLLLLACLPSSCHLPHTCSLCYLVLCIVLSSLRLLARLLHQTLVRKESMCVLLISFCFLCIIWMI